MKTPSSAPAPPRSAIDAVAERRGVQSVEIGVKLLEVIAAAGGSLSLKAIGEGARMPSSQAHRYLASFIRSGLVRQEPVSGRYDLGELALRLGLAALARLDSHQIAGEALQHLTTTLNLTALLVVWGPSGPVIVRWSRSSPPLVASLTVGSLLPATSSASGRVLVAFTPRGVTQLQVDAEMTPASRPELDDLLAEVRRRGFELVSGSVVPGLSAIGKQFHWRSRLIFPFAIDV